MGQFTAYYLSQAGFQVTVIDDLPAMPPASAGNCGLVRPSRVNPINSWHTLFQGLRWMGKKDAPLSIKPQLDYQFVKWFVAFAWHCRRSSVAQAAVARQQLLDKSWALYEDFFSKESVQSTWGKKGLLYTCITQDGVDYLRHDNEALPFPERHSRILSAQEVREIEPLVSEQVVGGGYCEVDGWLNPTDLLHDIRQINERQGVRFMNAQVDQLISKNRKVVAARCPNNEVSSEHFVLCAGAKSVPLARQVGEYLPVQPAKGYNLTCSTPLAQQPNLPVYMLEKKVVATPWSNGFRIGSTMEFSGYDLSLNPDRLNALKQAAESYMDISLDQVRMEPWAGWRPMASGGAPIIRPSRKMKNLTIATGHGMLGLSMAPATGLMVQEIIAK